MANKSFSVNVIEKVVVHAKEACNDHWLPFTNLDLLIATFDVASFFCYKKPSHGSFATTVDALKDSLSRALTLFYPLAGEIQWNSAAGENQFHCNNRGVDFTQAVADVELKELNLYNPDESIEGKLIPKKLHGVLAIQVTELKCGGIVIGCVFNHRAVDGYSANMFFSSWAEITRSEPPSILPSFERSIVNPRSPTTYNSRSVERVYCIFEPPTKPDHDHNNKNGDDLLINRVYNIEGEQLNGVQQLASENGCKRSKLVAFTSYLWKIVSLSMVDSGNHNEVCNVCLPVDGRSRLAQGDEEREKLMASYFGNVVSMPYGSRRSQELTEMSLSDISKEVHEFLENATRKDHFLDLIDWAQERRSHPLISIAFASKEMSILVSSGIRFHVMNKMDFGWGKGVFGSCHVPSGRSDCYVMTSPSPTNDNDWIVYLHLPKKHLNYIESHASHMFKPLTSDYLGI